MYINQNLKEINFHIFRDKGFQRILKRGNVKAEVWIKGVIHSKKHKIISRKQRVN